MSRCDPTHTPLGVYDISSPHFIMRIRLHTGHQRGLNVILRPASFREFDEDQPGIQLGIGSFVLFQGEDLDQVMVEVQTDQDFLNQAQLLSEASEYFGMPYLLGQKDDFESVREMMRKRGEADLDK